MRIRRKSVNGDAFDHPSEMMDMGNICICCGDPIPEGRQVCPICEDRAEEAAHQQRRDTDEEGSEDDGT